MKKKKLYWDDFNVALKVNQILMTHEVGRSLEYLENKVYSKNKKTKELFKQKINYEDQLVSLSLNLQTPSNEYNDKILSEYIDVKEKINEIENNLKKTDYKIR